jgi:hypothetical protein
MDRESTLTDSDKDPISLEDMLDAEFLAHPEYEDVPAADEDENQDQLRHLIRFDRVPVSTYLRRNFIATGPGGSLGRPRGGNDPTSGAVGAGDTLVGPARMLVSPILGPVDGFGAAEGEMGRMSRKERRKAKRIGTGLSAMSGSGGMGTLAPLELWVG